MLGLEYPNERPLRIVTSQRCSQIVIFSIPANQRMYLQSSLLSEQFYIAFCNICSLCNLYFCRQLRGQLIIRFQTWYIVSKMAYKLAHQILSFTRTVVFLATEKGKFHEKPKWPD